MIGICYNILSVLVFWLWGMGSWLSNQGYSPVPSAMNGKILTTGQRGKSLLSTLYASNVKPLTSPQNIPFTKHCFLYFIHSLIYLCASFWGAIIRKHISGRYRSEQVFFLNNGFLLASHTKATYTILSNSQHPHPSCFSLGYSRPPIRKGPPPEVKIE